MPIVDTTASLECFFVREAACGGYWEKKGREDLQGLAWDCRQGGGLVTRVQGCKSGCSSTAARYTVT